MTNNSEQAGEQFVILVNGSWPEGSGRYRATKDLNKKGIHVIEYTAFQKLKEELEKWKSDYPFNLHKVVAENERLKEELLNYGKAVTHFEDKAEKLQQKNERLSKENDQLVLRMSELRETRRESDEQIKMLTEENDRLIEYIVETETMCESLNEENTEYGRKNKTLTEENEKLKLDNQSLEVIRETLAKLRQGGGDE